MKSIAILAIVALTAVSSNPIVTRKDVMDSSTHIAITNPATTYTPTDDYSPKKSPVVENEGAIVPPPVYQPTKEDCEKTKKTTYAPPKEDCEKSQKGTDKSGTVPPMGSRVLSKVNARREASSASSDIDDILKTTSVTGSGNRYSVTAALSMAVLIVSTIF